LKVIYFITTFDGNCTTGYSRLLTIDFRMSKLAERALYSNEVLTKICFLQKGQIFAEYMSAFE